MSYFNSVLVVALLEIHIKGIHTSPNNPRRERQVCNTNLKYESVMNLSRSVLTKNHRCDSAIKNKITLQCEVPAYYERIQDELKAPPCSLNENQCAFY
jgi:hypothetical protein